MSFHVLPRQLQERDWGDMFRGASLVASEGQEKEASLRGSSGARATRTSTVLTLVLCQGSAL